MSSEPERNLLQEMRWLKFSEPEAEYRFDSTRRWKFDFAWPEKMLAVEVEGGAFVNGRHTRGLAFQKDCEKYNEAALQGWLVLRVTPAQITSGEAIGWIDRGLHQGVTA